MKSDRVDVVVGHHDDIINFKQVKGRFTFLRSIFVFLAKLIVYEIKEFLVCVLISLVISEDCR